MDIGGRWGGRGRGAEEDEKVIATMGKGKEEKIGERVGEVMGQRMKKGNGEGLKKRIGERVEERTGERMSMGIGEGMGMRLEGPVEERTTLDIKVVPYDRIESIGIEPKEAVVFRYGVRSVRAAVSTYDSTSSALGDISTAGRIGAERSDAREGKGEGKGVGKGEGGGGRVSRNRPVTSDRKKNQSTSVRNENRIQRDLGTVPWDGSTNF